MSAIVYYVFQGPSVLVGAPHLLTIQNKKIHLTLTTLTFTTQQILGLALFFTASYLQFDTHQRLAALRTSGKVKKNSHGLPEGGMFKFLSSPHYFAEALIYISFQSLIGWQHIPSLCITFCTILNQLACAAMSHSWYLGTFGKSFPRERRMFVPFVF